MNPILPIAGLGAVGLILYSTTASAASDTVSDPNATAPIDYSNPTTGDTNVFGQSTGSPDESAQVNAFLGVIRTLESSNNYGAYVGGGSFTDFTHHPADPPTNWPGRPGPTHACGAYQFEPQTWREARDALSLPDFSPPSQDAAAVFLLKRRGAYSAIVSGDIATACDLLRNEWESFSQSRGSPTIVASMFESNGGTQA